MAYDSLMPVPDYQSLMLPLLEGLADGKEHPLADLREEIALRLGLTAVDRELLLPSGRQPVYDNRLGWAKTISERRDSSSQSDEGSITSLSGGGPSWPSGRRALTLRFLLSSQSLKSFGGGLRSRRARARQPLEGFTLQAYRRTVPRLRRR